MTTIVDKTTGEVTETGKPGYGQWVYHIYRKWNPPASIKRPVTRKDGTTEVVDESFDLLHVLGLAVMMASFGKDGSRIHPSAGTLAKRSGMTDRGVKNLRRQAIQLGLFRQTGNVGRVPELEVTLPPDSPHREAGFPMIGNEASRYLSSSKKNLSNRQEETEFPIEDRPTGPTYPDSNSFATGDSERSELYESSDREACFPSKGRPETVTLDDGTEVDIPADVLEDPCGCSTCSAGFRHPWGRPRIPILTPEESAKDPWADDSAAAEVA